MLVQKTEDVYDRYTYIPTGVYVYIPHVFLF